MQHAGGVLLARAGPSETFIKSIPVSGKIIYRMIRAEANQSNTVRVSIDNRGKDKLQFIGQITPSPWGEGAPQGRMRGTA